MTSMLRLFTQGTLVFAAALSFPLLATAQVSPFPANAPVGNYGTGGAGTGGIAPSLTTNGLPRVGNAAFEVIANDIVGGAPGFVILSMGGVDLPLPGLGRLYVAPPFVTFFGVTADGTPGAAGAGSATVAFPIPSSPGMVGAALPPVGTTWPAAAPGLTRPSTTARRCAVRPARTWPPTTSASGSCDP